MPAEQQVPADAPVMKAWEAYKMTEDYANSRKWAQHEAHVDGSMWAAFYQGFFAAAIVAVEEANKRPDGAEDCIACAGLGFTL
jgi:hypothetical protein